MFNIFLSCMEFTSLDIETVVKISRSDGEFLDEVSRTTGFPTENERPNYQKFCLVNRESTWHALFLARVSAVLGMS